MALFSDRSYLSTETSVLVTQIEPQEKPRFAVTNLSTTLKTVQFTAIDKTRRLNKQWNRYVDNGVDKSYYRHKKRERATHTPVTHLYNNSPNNSIHALKSLIRIQMFTSPARIRGIWTKSVDLQSIAGRLTTHPLRKHSDPQKDPSTSFKIKKQNHIPRLMPAQIQPWSTNVT